MGSLKIKAGKRAYEIIKDGGSVFDLITTYYGPAAGPRWLVASGFDRTLLEGDFWAPGRIVYLVGTSAGAWRFASWVQPRPLESYRDLIDSYIALDYRSDDTPPSILGAMENLVNRYLDDDALPFALANKRYRLVVMACRAKHLLASRWRFFQRIGLGVAFLANAWSRSWLFSFASRVVFYQGPRPPFFCLQKDFQGEAVPLTEVNFKQALLASGAIPLIVKGIRDIYGAPYGYYVDGGLIDYHLTQRLNGAPDDLTLFFHHQERIIPGWLDQRFKGRATKGEILDNVLLVYPSEDLLARLPGGRIPDRTDYLTYLNAPGERRDNWRKTVNLSAPLGEEFVELVMSNRLRQVVERIEPIA